MPSFDYGLCTPYCAGMRSSNTLRRLLLRLTCALHTLFTGDQSHLQRYKQDKSNDVGSGGLLGFIPELNQRRNAR